MPDQIRRLLHTHEFFSRAIRDYQAVMSPAHVDGLKTERNRVFAQLVDYASASEQVTRLQFGILLAAMEELSDDKQAARRLRKACEKAADRLLWQCEPGEAVARPPVDCAPAPLITPQSTWLLDDLTDRAAICDGDYRYLYANKANARFHRRSIADFAGADVASVIGDKYFEEITKPMVARCFVGETVTFVVAYKGERAAFSAKCEPIRSSTGEVVAAMYISRKLPARPRQGKVLELVRQHR